LNRRRCYRREGEWPLLRKSGTMGSVLRNPSTDVEKLKLYRPCPIMLDTNIAAVPGE